jgi:hypothetical protein
MEVLNGTEQQAELAANQPAPSVEKIYVEPDTSGEGASALFKVTVGVTLFVVFSIFGVKAVFDYTLSEELKANKYNYSQRAVAPSYRNVE